MTHRSLVRLLSLGSAITLLIIVSGMLVGEFAVGSACPTWPWCGERLGNDNPATVLALAHRVLIPILLLLLLPAMLFVLRRPDLDRLVRLPLLLAPPILLAQIGFGAAMVLLQRYDLADAGHFALALLVLALQVVPLAALLQPAMPNQRQGARTARSQSRQALLLWGVVAAIAVLALALGATPVPLNQLITAGPALGLGGALVAALSLNSGAWLLIRRTRPSDRLLARVVGGSALLLIAGAPFLAGDPISRSLGAGFLTLALIAALAAAIFAMRRPLPEALLPTPAAPAAWRLVLNDYISLTKPKVISLLLVTTLAAMYLTPAGLPSLWLIFWTMLGGYLAAGGAGAINCALDSDLDVNMGRTSRRPVPSGRISARAALIFGLSLSALSTLIMLVFTTPLAAFFSTLGIVYYAYFYTHLLKRSTWQNIIIGGGAGAIPPLVGWTAMTGTLDLAAIVLFAIVFYWTPPHFWALALVKAQDYARAGVPMLPVVAGAEETRYQIWIYSLLLVGLSLLLTPLGAMSWLYLILALLLGAQFLRDAWAVYRRGDQAAIWGLYKYSLLYLALLFVAMVLDRLLLA